MYGGSYSVFGEVHNYMETTAYKIHSRLVNGMLSAPHISTRGSLNRLFRVAVIPEQGNKMRLFLQNKLSRAILV